MPEIQAVELDFGETHFGKAPLGDVRRRRLLVALADQIVTHPAHSLPTQVENPAAYQAMLGLVKYPKVTHPAVLQTHLDRTRSRIQQHPGTVLIIHDTTELDYTSHKSLRKLGQIGDGKGRGYECHNSLAVVAATGEVLGLANQILHTRVKVPPHEGVAAKRERQSRESLLWLQGCAAVAQGRAARGPAPEGHLQVDVFDRGGDTFENLEAEHKAGRNHVARSNHNRAIYIGHEGTEPGLLHDYACTLPEQGGYHVEVQAREAKPASRDKPAVPAVPARRATVVVSWAAVQLRAPHVKRGKHGNDPLPVWVVRVWEVNAPAGVTPLEWILLTRGEVKDLGDACRVIKWYEMRWTIEDYHKCQKTGCKIEKMQFRSEERLESMIALMSVVATLLLQLRWLSRQEGLQETPATAVVLEAYVGVLSVALEGERRVDLGAWEFFVGLARLGGYGYYNQHKPPGFVVLWRGWAQLHSKLRYALAIGAETLEATDLVIQTQLAAIPDPSGLPPCPTQPSR